MLKQTKAPPVNSIEGHFVYYLLWWNKKQSNLIFQRFDKTKKRQKLIIIAFMFTLHCKLSVGNTAKINAFI